MRTYELLSIIGSIFAAGIALGAVVIASNANLHGELRTEMHALRAEVGTEMKGLRTEVGAEMQSLRTEFRAEIADVRGDLRSVENRLAAVERRQARTESLLEGLRDAITAQRPEVAREQAEAT